LKVTLRAAEPYNLLESEFEKVIRKTVRRGTVQVHLRCQRQLQPKDYQINPVALRSYLAQVKSVCQELGLADGRQALLPQGVNVPGVRPEPAAASLPLEDDWPVVERVLEEALKKLQSMRQEEGKAMAAELLQLRGHIGRHLDHIRQCVPQVTVAYRDRLLE